MSNSLDLFNTNTKQWFERNIGTPTAVQEEGWNAIASGSDVLISAPTGTGKTFAAFLIFIDKLKELAKQEKLKDQLYLIYISPLKALGNDIQENLKKPLNGIEEVENSYKADEIINSTINVAVRTGDTTSRERQQMIKRPPHILITTPESLYLLLTSMSGQKILSTAKAVIIDEIHALISNKRGAHLMFSLARLDKLCEKSLQGLSLQRIGLSATVKPLETAAQYLSPNATASKPVKIVAPEITKDYDIAVISPTRDMNILPDKTIWPEIAKTVYSYCQNERTVIAFVDGRKLAEQLAYNVNLIGGEGYARTHHGCVSKEQRLEAEKLLKAGKLKLLCATSSMELGIDVGEVDLVVQVGAPKGISSTLQRLGRAGHNPGRASIMIILPRTIEESLYCGLAAKVTLDGGIEHVKPPHKCFDILSQHLVSMAAATQTGYTVGETMELMNKTYNFRDVTKAELQNVLCMLAGDYEHELERPARPRILYDRIHETIQGDSYSRILAISSSGTIPDYGWFSVVLPDGTKLGELDEEYVFEARVGDKFLLGSFSWKIKEITKDKIYVTQTNSEGAQPPFWKSMLSGREYQTGLAFGEIFQTLNKDHLNGDLYRKLRDIKLDDAAAQNVFDYLKRQINVMGKLPDHKTILIEHFKDQSGENQIMIHSIFGHNVNSCLELILKEKLERILGAQIATFKNDNGILIRPYCDNCEFPDGILKNIDPNEAEAYLNKVLPSTPMFNMLFRYSASRSLMMGVSRGKRLPLWIQRLRSAEYLNDAANFDDHPLIVESKRECLEENWDIPALKEVLANIKSGEIEVIEKRLFAQSPMSLNLRRQVEASMMYDYNPTPRNTTSMAAGKTRKSASPAMFCPSQEHLDALSIRSDLPKDINRFHSLLMAEGDMVAGEIDVPADWPETLVKQERALYIEPGLWICAEHADQYKSAFEEDDYDLKKRITRRCLRFRGPQSVKSLSDRYFLDEDLAQKILSDLDGSNAAVEKDGLYYHAEIYNKAGWYTLSAKRKEIETSPSEKYQSLLYGKMFNLSNSSLDSAGQLEIAIKCLLDQPFPPHMWENVLFPARVNHYTPVLLDGLLSQGKYFWKFLKETQDNRERILLSFHKYEDIDWNAPILANDISDENLSAIASEAREFLSPLFLSHEEKSILKVLSQRGASFIQNFSHELEIEEPLPILFKLAENGYINSDSFKPVRHWLEKDKQSNFTVKQRAKVKVAAMTNNPTVQSGRWEILRPIKELSSEEKLNRAFDKVIILCKETAQSINLNWSEAIESLRIWEYTGQARRGYFIKGLSGAQFIRELDFNKTISELEQEDKKIIWLNAADPAMQLGKSLPSVLPFLNINSTAAALSGGTLVALLEKQGNILKIFEPGMSREILEKFVLDFKSKKIFPNKDRIIIKDFPEGSETFLAEVGFRRQMLDYVLWQT